MAKKILLLLLSLVWVWAVQQRWGDLPLLSRFFTYATSPLQVDDRFNNPTELRETPFGPVEVGFDTLGIPYIFGEDERAVDYATGFVHARDRLFQMEMIVRVTTGRVSEVAGPAALKSDLFWRKMAFDSLVPIWYAGMADSLPALTARLEAYAQGVNDYQRLMPYGALPLEYHLLGIDPMAWKAENIFYLLKYMTHVLTYSEDDLKASEMRAAMGSTLYDFWFPYFTAEPHPIYPDFVLDDAVFAKLLPEVVEELADGGAHSYPQAFIKNNDELSLGSNNWAVQGSKSTTGNPFLCNDTHLQIGLPSTWYEVHKAVNGKVRRGFSIAGSPFVITGFNDSLAWGMTNATWDLVDFYELKVNDDTTAYWLDGAWEPLEAYEVRIAVKGQPDHVQTYYRSYFGPVDIYNGRFLAVNWIGLLASNEALAFNGLENGHNVQQAEQALRHFQQPPQNLVLADHRGQIGLITAGKACLHPLPTKGIRKAQARAQKIGFVALNDHLQSINPAREYVHSANQEHVDHPLSAHLSTRYEPAARGQRIIGQLEEQTALGRAELSALQLDIVDMQYFLLEQRMKEAAGASDRWLAGWAGSMQTHLVAPTLFYNFKNHLVSAIVDALGGGLALPPSEQHIFWSVANYDSLPGLNGWLRSADLAKAAWDSSWADLIVRFGPDPASWTYDRFHLSNFQHLLRLPQLSIPQFPSPGSNRTVSVASRLPSTHAASMRTVIEMRPEGPRALLLLTGGQSGRFNSANYHDQVPDWLEGRYHEAYLPGSFDASQYQTTIRFNRK